MTSCCAESPKYRKVQAGSVVRKSVVKGAWWPFSFLGIYYIFTVCSECNYVATVQHEMRGGVQATHTRLHRKVLLQN